MKPYLCFALGLLTALGCAPVTTTTVCKLITSSFQSKPGDCAIQVFMEAPSNRKFEEIAVLTSIDQTFEVPLVENKNKELNGMLPKVKTKACELGADAIIIKSYEPEGNGKPAQVVTVAIKFLD